MSSWGGKAINMHDFDVYMPIYSMDGRKPHLVGDRRIRPMELV